MKNKSQVPLVLSSIFHYYSIRMILNTNKEFIQSEVVVCKKEYWDLKVKLLPLCLHSVGIPKIRLVKLKIRTDLQGICIKCSAHPLWVIANKIESFTMNDSVICFLSDMFMAAQCILTYRYLLIHNVYNVQPILKVILHKSRWVLPLFVQYTIITFWLVYFQTIERLRNKTMAYLVNWAAQNGGGKKAS